MNEFNQTFKLQSEVWNERPRLISQENVDVQHIQGWRNSVHFLEQWDQIIHIVHHEDDTKIALLFFTGKTPF